MQHRHPPRPCGLGALQGIALTLLLAGCASSRAERSAQYAEDLGVWDEAVGQYTELLEREPTNIEYRAGLLRSRLQASREHLATARRWREEGALEAALHEYRLAIQLDSGNDRATAEMRRVVDELAHLSAQERGESAMDELQQRAHRGRARQPMLSPRSDDPIDLSFPEPVPVRDIYAALSKGFGIDILFDRELENRNLALELREVRMHDAAEMVMRAAGHFYKVLDEHTVFVAEDTPQNRQKYEDLLIQIHYLSNADPAELITVLRALIEYRDILPNEILNAIVLRDSADKVRVAQRIIEANDKSRGEVVVDLELMQIDVGRLQQLGVAPSDYRVIQALGERALPIRLSDPEHIGRRAGWLLTMPGAVYDALKSETVARFLARPQLRISDGGRATLHIGDQVPIPVSSFTTTETVEGTFIIPFISFQYQDVGIRVDMEPRIHHNDEITLTLKVEVSSVTGTVPGSQGTSQPVISTRTIESTIRLRDGETSVLAGLIQTRENRAKRGAPSLSSIPLLGRLFSRDRTQHDRTELVLTLSPHIVRTTDVTARDLQPIWVGAEQGIAFRGNSPRVESEAEGPLDRRERSSEEIRERLERPREE